MMSALGWMATVALALVPLAVNPDLLDRYRVLKESLVRTEGIVGGVLLVAAAALAGTRRFRELLRERPVVIVTAAGVFWALVTTIFSTHRAHSVDSLVTLLTSAIVFVMAWYAAPRISLLILDLLVPVAILNVALVTMQEYGIRQPFYFDPLLSRHLTATGLIDNPNVVGSYMTLLTVIFAAAALRVPGWRRWLYTLGAIVTTAGVLVSQTRTAFIALIAGLLLLAVGRSVKRIVVAVTAVAILFGAGVYLKNPAVMNVLALPQRVRTESLEVATSGRAAPVAAALQMMRDHPLTGVGPGAFKYHFMRYKSLVVDRYPRTLRGTTGTNFGEAHNDHAQLLAETGLPGYLLFLATIFVIVRAVRERKTTDARSSIARGIALPLAGTLLVLALAQFPLYVAITRQLLVTMAGLLIGWSRPWAEPVDELLDEPAEEAAA